MIFLLFHELKEYLNYCHQEIIKFLDKEKLQLNKKRIFKSTDNYTFLGRNSKGKYIRYRNVKRKLKARKYLYEIRKLPLNSMVSSATCYGELLKYEINKLL